jgi:predicted nucleotidyltransferase
VKSSQSQRDQMLNILKNIIIDTLCDVPVNVYLFGSWARKEEKKTSDIDIALQSAEEIPVDKWVELREKIEESILPYKVDLVDLSKASPAIIEKVRREGILWRDYWNDSSLQTKH